MLTRSLPLFLAVATLGQASATHHRLLKQEQDNAIDMARRLQRKLQFDGIPDVCSGFELLIDQIPEGRDSCDCDGTSVNCLFRAHCPEGEEDEPHCADVVEYIINVEDKDVTVTSCALIVEGGFDETCAQVSIAPDLALGECLQGTYGGKPCDCSVCDDRGSLLLDCSQYDSRAVTSCQAMGMGQLSPLSNGFNSSAPRDSLDDEFPVVNDVEAETSGSRQTTVALSSAAVLVSVGAML